MSCCMKWLIKSLNKCLTRLRKHLMDTLSSRLAKYFELVLLLLRITNRFKTVFYKTPQIRTINSCCVSKSFWLWLKAKTVLKPKQPWLKPTSLLPNIMWSLPKQINTVSSLAFLQAPLPCAILVRIITSPIYCRIFILSAGFGCRLTSSQKVKWAGFLKSAAPCKT